MSQKIKAKDKKSKKHSSTRLSKKDREAVKGLGILQAPNAEGQLTQLQQVVSEILTSEERYVKDLNLMVQYFLRPIREQKLLPSDVLFDIFSNIELVCSLNTDLLGKLRSALSEEKEVNMMAVKTGDVFMEMAPQLVGAYSGYCNDHMKAITLLSETIKKNTSFSEFLDQQRSVKELEGLSLGDFLVKPVQRICKYPLLFREVVRSGDDSQGDWENVKDAMMTLEKVAEVVNRRKQEMEDMQAIREVSSMIKGYKGLEKVGRRLIKRGELLKYNKNMKAQWRYFFLFNDLMIYAEGKHNSYQYKGDIPLDASLVEPLGDGEYNGKAIQYGFRITRLDTKRQYPLASDSVESRDAWVKALDDVISGYLDEAMAKQLAGSRVGIEIPEDVQEVVNISRKSLAQSTTSLTGSNLVMQTGSGPASPLVMRRGTVVEPVEDVGKQLAAAVERIAVLERQMEEMMKRMSALEDK